MNLGDLTGLVEKPFAAVSNLVNTPNSAGRYRPFYLRNLLDAVQGRTLHDAVDGTITLITGGSSGIGEAAAKKIADAGGEVVLVARTREKPGKGRRRDPQQWRHGACLPVRSVRHGRHRRDGRSGAG